MILKNLIYIYQLENYDKKRFLYFSYRHLNWLNLNKRNSLIWTTRSFLIYLINFFIFFIDTIFLLVSINKFFIIVCLNIVALPLFVIFADILISPLILFQKKRIINKATKLIEKNKQNKLITIGITGSYGKTSMKNILVTILEEKFRVFTFPGNINTDIGVSQYLIKKQKEIEEAEILVSEMGAYKKGDIRKLCSIVVPDYSILTSIGESHLERFGSIQNIISTKFELANFTKKKIFLNIGNEKIQKFFNTEIKKKINILKICEKQNMKDFIYKKNFNGISFRYRRQNFSTKLISDYSICFFNIALEVATELGLNELEKEKGVQKVNFVPHRLEIIKNKNLNRVIIDDSYNGNYDGFLSGLNVLDRAERRKVVLTPGIVELGIERSEKIHKELALVYAKKVDLVLLIKNKNTDFIVEKFREINYNSFKEYDNSEEAHRDLSNILREGDTIIFQNDTSDNY